MEEWKALSLTHVVYKKGNPISQVLAFITLSPIFVMCAMGGAVATTRSLRWFWALIGAFAVEFGCSLLKDVIAQPRPEGSYRGGFGMPSEHAAVGTFLATHLTIHVLVTIKCKMFLLKLVAIVALWSWAFLVAISRVHMGVHSAYQVLVGAMLGIGIGLFWFTFEHLTQKHFAAAQSAVDRSWKALGIQFPEKPCTD